MGASIQVSYPASLLQVVSISPESQPGFSVEETNGELKFDALFEGELRTSIPFQQTQTANRQ